MKSPKCEFSLEQEFLENYPLENPVGSVIHTNTYAWACGDRGRERAAAQPSGG